MVRPRVIVLTGYGINCEEETAYAFDKAGACTRIVHINDLIDRSTTLGHYQIFAIPGGFSYGDDTGSGKALANRMRNHLDDELFDFIAGDRLMIGICNGFQVLVNLGLLPSLGSRYGQRQAALLHNDSARYIDRWVDLEFSGDGPWTHGLGTISVPVAHGEGKLYVPDLETLKKNGHVAARYTQGEICEYLSLPANPNGSIDDIAALHDPSKRIIGMMPHPERAIDFTHLPNWTLLKQHYKRIGLELPKDGPGLRLFMNGVEYFK